MAFRLSTEEVLKMNKKIHTFVLMSDSLDIQDANLFVVTPPPDGRDPSHQAPLQSMSDLCSTCRGALGYVAYYIETLATGGKDAVEDVPPACLLHDGAETLQRGEDDSCHLCVLIMSDLRTKRIALEGVAQSRIEMCWQSDPPLARLHLALVHGGHPRATDNYWNFLKLQLWPFSEHGTELFVGAGGVGSGRAGSTGSEQSRELAVEWLSVCQANEDGRHSQCNQGQGDWLPTRLLDVTYALETGRLRLVLPRESPEEFVSSNQYLTLSHCWGAWGSAELPVLTVQNLSERKDIGVDTSLLPKTFKEALEVAEWFKCRWLWIDSLCIIQDSTEDWQREAVMMYNVYKGALLNISADDSNDARWGCFRNRDPLVVLPMRLQLPGQDGWDYWLTPDSTGVFEAITKAPLAKRAWVFQERQLSRRVLHFTSREVVWECCAEGSYFACETFPRGAPFKSLFGDRPKYQGQGPGGSEAEVHATWDMLCQSYSEKKLTQLGDKTVALSGLAQEFQALLPQDVYVSGMWRSLLPQSLLWKSADASGHVQADKYIAPSWSWLSIDGPVSNLSPRGISLPVMEVLNVKTEPVIPSEPTASLRGAYIDLRCYLRRVEIRPDYEVKPWYMLAMGGGKNHVLAVGDGEIELGSFSPPPHSDTFDYSFDVVSVGDSGPNLISGYFLPISMDDVDESSSAQINGLLVEPVDGDLTTFRRIGTMTCHGLHCLPLLYKVRDVGRTDRGNTEITEQWDKLRSLLGASYKSWKDIRKDSRLKEPAVDSSTIDLDGSSSRHDPTLTHGVGEPLSTKTVPDDAVKSESDAAKAESESDGELAKISPDVDLNEVEKSMEVLNVTENKTSGEGCPTVNRKALEALERLYASDGTYLGSELEQNFERLAARQIRLI